ncbi:photosystem II biogenesis protein Psp29 [Leptolyngbya sp. FACHB-261]|nr:photosystem II biogenesis protein Psp29 [Leptolyngbya sp. FACHB-261]
MNNIRTVSDTKRAFCKAYVRPINSVYRRVVEELTVELHLLLVNTDFRYDPIFALGMVTAFEQFMQGYRPESEREPIFNALTQSLELDPNQLRQDASRLLELADRRSAETLTLLTRLESTEAELSELQNLLQSVAGNPKFRYSRLFAIGLFALLQQGDSQAMADDGQRKSMINQVSGALKLPDDKLTKDLDLYRTNLEKVAQARQVMDDILKADRKKREQRATTTSSEEEAPSETPS